MNYTVTYSKAIGILLMVLCHAGCPYEIFRYVYMFHMPLFFFLSGFCFKTKYLEAPKEFIIKKIRGIYIPYMISSLVFLFLHNFFFKVNIYNENIPYHDIYLLPYTFQELLYRTIRIFFNMDGHDQLLGGFWFLRDLILTSFISFIILQLCKKSRKIVLAIVFFLAGCTVLSYTQRHIPLLPNHTILATALFLTGHLFKRENLEPLKIKGCIACALFVGIGSIFWPGEMLSLPPSHFICLYFISAVTGTWMVYSLCTYIRSDGYFAKALNYIGTHTLIVLTLHFISFKIVSICIVGIYHLTWENIACFPTIREFSSQGWYCIYFLFGISLPLIFQYYYDSLKKHLKRKTTD